MSPEINSLDNTKQGQKRRILFVVTQSEFGGAQRFLFEILSKLDRQKYDLSLATGTSGDKTFSEAIRGLGIPVYLLNSLKRNEDPFHDIQAVWELRNLIKKTTPDTLFLGSSKAGFIGSLSAKFCRPRPKVIYRIGGWSFNDPQPAWKKQFRIALERLSAGWKNTIIVNNLHDLAQAKELNISPREDVVLVHNGIDPFRLNLLPREEARVRLSRTIPTALGIDLQHKKIIGTLANFYPTKGLQYLIESVSHIADPNAIICIIGDGEERPKLEQLIKKYGLEHKVFLIGRLPEASQYLSAFDVFACASVKEGFPWAVLEAMAAKLPVVATGVGAVPEIISDGVSGYIVEPRNPEQLAKQINTLLGNELNAHEMGIQAHQRILFAFTSDTMISQIEKLL